MRNKLSMPLIMLLITGKIIAGGIHFQTTSFQEALAKSRKEHKMLFVDAYATWCGPCKRMEREVFEDKAVGKFFNEHFINYRINMESPEGLEFDKKYSVQAYPTFFFIDTAGNVALRKTGYRDAEAFLQLGPDALDANPDTLTAMKAMFEAGKRDKDFLAGYVLALIDNDMPCKQPADEYLKHIPPGDLFNDTAFYIFSKADNALQSDLMNFFISNIKDFYFVQGSQQVKGIINNALIFNIGNLDSVPDKQEQYDRIILFINSVVPAVSRSGLVEKVNEMLEEKGLGLKLSGS